MVLMDRAKRSLLTSGVMQSPGSESLKREARTVATRDIHKWGKRDRPSCDSSHASVIYTSDQPPVSG